MSGLDPLAALALTAVANAQAAIEESTLNLGSLLADFQAQLSVGDVVRATVLPAQNGVDRLSLLGQTITAQLPPGINPGETLALAVTGFTNTAIIVRNLGVVADDAPLPEAPPQQSTPGTPQRAVLRSTTPPPPAPASGIPPRPVVPPPPRAPSGPVAPPREIFVQAAVRSNPQASAPAADVPTSPAPEVEARLAATRASRTIGSPAEAKAPVQSSTPAPPRASNPTSSRPLAQPPLTRGVAPHVSAPVLASVRPAPATPEAALLARLRVPVSATTVAAAKIVDAAARSVTAAFEKLDALLDRAPADPRISTLRSTLPFVARFDLRNTTALPEQLASYVSNVVSSAETKLAQIVRAWTTGTLQATLEPQPPIAPPATSQPSPEPDAPLNAPPTPARTIDRIVLPPPAAHPELTVNNAARAAERSIALDHDVKTALLALVSDPPQGSSPALLSALRDALTATTSVQLSTLNAQTVDPQSITIPLPAYFYEGGQPAQLRISRDAPGSRKPMDADNFHVAFILDTKSLGTVAIDVQTAGRSISVDVKTEHPRAADRFRTSFVDLRSRLEQLHYRIATMAAGLAPRGTSTEDKAPQSAAPERTSNLDLQA
ncbi:MAG TPA: flagellar hook-length control protein FliK [Candidatus Aquilonibacter sp.]|nr:flagellar hook-length control protein FliK [Candidatus Aquilonibacter sp.]